MNTDHRLVEAGYTVSAMNRTEENDDRLRRAGAHPVRVDLFDVEALSNKKSMALHALWRKRSAIYQMRMPQSRLEGLEALPVVLALKVFVTGTGSFASV